MARAALGICYLPPQSLCGIVVIMEIVSVGFKGAVVNAYFFLRPQEENVYLPTDLPKPRRHRRSVTANE